MKDNFINKNIYTYLKGKLKKFEFDVEDLKSLESMNICAFDMGENFISNSLNDLKYFTNLKNLEISKYILNRENIKIIESLSSVENYIFKDIDVKDKINIAGKKLIISNCKKCYNFIMNFDSIEIEASDISDVNLESKNIVLKYCKNIENANIKTDNLEIAYINLKENEIQIIKNFANMGMKIVINNCKYNENVFDGIQNIKILNKAEGENIE
jgi:hypothetical protein